jgi:uncharacterized protein (DUF697 family)
VEQSFGWLECNSRRFFFLPTQRQSRSIATCIEIKTTLKSTNTMAAHATAADRPALPKEEAPAPTKEAEASRIIGQNVLWAAGGGVIPFPLIDMVAVTVVELKMLKELSALYEVPFKEDRVKSILVSLLAGLGAPVLGTALTVSLVKSIPVAGFASAFLAVPSLAAAFTYAVGKVFVQHFASGGTFLDFDPKTVREYFARQFEEGKLAVSKMKTESPPQKTS